VPLGPFTAKNFATTISPWVVTAEALEAVKCAAPVQDLAPVLPYLTESDRHTFDVPVQVAIRASGHTKETAGPHTSVFFPAGT
jgi:fumarylacetoacetase